MTEVATPIETRTEESAPATPSKSENGTQIVLPLSLAEFEALIRRVVREEVGRLVRAPEPSIPDDSSHEGVEEPGDEEDLVQAALEAIREHEANPNASMNWEDFEEELR